MKKLLILDIDNTLIYSHKDINVNHDFVLKFNDGDVYYVNKRPYLDEFLNYCKNNFRIGFWSAATENYVNEVLKHILGDLKPELVWSEKRCTFKIQQTFFEYTKVVYKKLKKVWKKKDLNVSKKDVLILDDTYSTYKYNYGNAINIDRFFGEEDDIELLRIVDLLESIKECDDVRIVPKFHLKKIEI